MPVTSAGKEFPVLPAGTYDAVLADIVTKPNQLVKGATKLDPTTGLQVPVYKTRFIFDYAVGNRIDPETGVASPFLDKDGQQYSVAQFAWDSDVLSPKSNLAPILLKLSGKKPERNQDFDNLIGTQVRIITIQSEPNAAGKVFANIDHMQRNPNGKVVPQRGFRSKSGKAAQAGQTATTTATQNAAQNAAVETVGL